MRSKSVKQLREQTIETKLTPTTPIKIERKRSFVIPESIITTQRSTNYKKFVDNSRISFYPRESVRSHSRTEGNGFGKVSSFKDNK